MKSRPAAHCAVFLLALFSSNLSAVLSQTIELPPDNRSKSRVLQGRIEKTVSKGSAGQGINSPIQSGEQELSIEWDKWRNRFTRAVWYKANQKLAGGDVIFLGGLCLKFGDAPALNFEKGLSVTYSCDISSNRQISNIRVHSSSGNTAFDELIVGCVRAISGKRILQFPKGSQRQLVMESSTLTVGRREFHETKYDDIEKIRVSLSPE